MQVGQPGISWIGGVTYDSHIDLLDLHRMRASLVGKVPGYPSESTRVVTHDHTRSILPALDDRRRKYCTESLAYPPDWLDFPSVRAGSTPATRFSAFPDIGKLRLRATPGGGSPWAGRSSRGYRHSRGAWG
jgi:hypothetical protein